MKQKESNILNRRKYFQSEMDLKEMIIIDNGSETIKIGRSGVDYPSVIINTISGYAQTISQNDASPPKSVYFGKELEGIIDSKKYNITFSYPIVNSKILDNYLDDMIDLWDYALNQLMGVDPSGSDILIIDSPSNDKNYKAKIIEMLFDKLKVGSVLFMNSSVLSLFSVGLTVGLVCELGHGTSTVVPVYEGFILNHALQKSNFAGSEITKQLQAQLKKSNISLDSKDEINYMEIIRKVKQDNVKVAFDYENELKSDQRTQEERSYQLPDGSVIELSKECVYSPGQILFKEHQDHKSLPEMIETSLERCHEDLQQDIMKKVIFCGGSSMLHGLEYRIHKQLSRYGEELRVEFDWQRRYSAWIGGSMIGSLSSFQQLAIHSKDIPQNASINEIIKRIL